MKRYSTIAQVVLILSVMGFAYLFFTNKYDSIQLQADEKGTLRCSSLVSGNIISPMGIESYNLQLFQGGKLLTTNTTKEASYSIRFSAAQDKPLALVISPTSKAGAIAPQTIDIANLKCGDSINDLDIDL